MTGALVGLTLAVAVKDILIGIDIGGTFTDVVAIVGDGSVHIGKVASTPPDFSEGFFNALRLMADGLGFTADELVERTERLSHGTTVATNALVERRGARVGLLATVGHGDAILLMRGEGRTAGLPAEVIARVHESVKPEPIVERALIREIHERVDVNGRVIVPLDEEQAGLAVRELLTEGVDAIAVALLWSFKNGTHERRVREIVREAAGDRIFVTCSSELVPRMGEYERTAAAALNAFVGPPTVDYLRSISSRLEELHYDEPLYVMQCTGGVAVEEAIRERPLFTFQSGPVGGVTASLYLAEALGQRNVITTDVGGTSFDVALVVDGEPLATSGATFSQYSFYLPMIDVRSIGAGGGSIARWDEVTGGLRVGPTSAGAMPGPACYGRGGTQPTVTDAALLLGYLDPEYFLGGRMKLDLEAARRAAGGLASKLSMSVEELAAGIVHIIEFQMTDLLRAMTIERGYDPRDFDVLVYGGAGPVHAAVYARELGAARAIVPLGGAASVWSALGVACADRVEVAERVEFASSPFDPTRLTAIVDELAAEVTARLSGEAVSVQTSVDLRYRGQLHEVELRLDHGGVYGVDSIGERFNEKYRQLYGEAAVLHETPLEAVTFRCRARSATRKPHFDARRDLPVARQTGKRPVYWWETGGFVSTAVFRVAAEGGVALPRVEGPCILDLPTTTIVVHPGQFVYSDPAGNVIIELAGKEEAP